MRELRTQESKKFEKFFEIIRKEAVEENSIFFLRLWRRKRILQR